MAILNSKGEKTTAQNKAKEILNNYLENFDLHKVEGVDLLKRTEPEKVSIFVDKLIERMKKALVVK